MKKSVHSHTKCDFHGLSNMRSNYNLSSPTVKLSFSYIAKSGGAVQSALRGKYFVFHLGLFGMGSEINFCKTLYYPPLQKHFQFQTSSSVLSVHLSNRTSEKKVTAVIAVVDLRLSWPDLFSITTHYFLLYLFVTYIKSLYA